MVVGKRLSTNRKGKLLSFVKTLVVALGIALFFALLGIFPGLGYLGEANVRVTERDPYGFWLVHADCNISYNPILYSFSWLALQGHVSHNFLFVSVPTYVGSGIRSPAWRSFVELEEEAILMLILDNVVTNIPFNFIVFTMIELMKMRDLYLSFIGGIIGFPIGGTFGAIACFLAGVLFVMLIVPRLKPRLRIFFLKRYLRGHRTFTAKNES